MIPVSADVKIWIAAGHTDMRRYAARGIMWSPGRPGTGRPRTGRISLSIIWMVGLLQHGDEFVRRREPPWLEGGPARGCQGFELFGWIGTQVDLGALQTGMAQPQRHLSNIARGLQHVLSTAVPLMSSAT